MDDSDNTQDDQSRFSWIKTGAAAGLVAAGSYAFLAIESGDFRIALVAASGFSVALGLFAYGLYQFLSVDRRTAVAQVATVATVVGAVVLLLMSSIQLSIRADLGGTDPKTLGAAFELAERVHLGLDVAWDVYFAVGMGLFGLAAYSHPRLGRVLGGLGMLIAIGLLVLNVAEFPIPPAAANSVDLGPVAGLWYLVVTVQIIRSLGWAEERLLGRSRTTRHAATEARGAGD